MRLYRGIMKEQEEEVKVVEKSWKNDSKHESFAAADKKRKLLLKKNKDNESFLVKVKRHGFGGTRYVVKTYTNPVAKESKYAKKKKQERVKRKRD
jgi:hypothetical protein|tara:strand:- start:931 stop:1215 length:285 start_codon:yes stop_codon:yes gene_type:complete